jgi:high-affinity Fe2+/Pb2+ permease
MWRIVFWVAALGIIVTYLFFWILGGIGFTDSIVLSVLVILLAVAWVVHSLLERRRATDGRDPRLVHARERRGF